MPLTPVLRRSLTDDVCAQISAEIYSGNLGAGDALPVESDLARMFGVSRITVRESLQRLAQAGLIGSRQGQGRTVLDFRRTTGLEALPSLIISTAGPINLDALRSAMEMRLCIGADVARLAAERADTALVRRLAAFLERMRAARDDDGALQRIAYEMWEALIEGSRNIAYRLAFNGLRTVYDRCFEAMTAVLSVEHRDYASYEAIAAAVSRRDGAAAQAAANRLLERGHGAIVSAAEAFASAGGMAPAEGLRTSPGYYSAVPRTESAEGARATTAPGLVPAAGATSPEGSGKAGKLGGPRKARGRPARASKKKGGAS